MSYKIQEIFTRFYQDYLDKYGLNYDFDKVARAIMRCKTGALGSNMSVCQDCGTSHIHYNSCRDRHCPSCQGLVKEKWIDKQKSKVIDAPYFHVVFTVPSELNPLIYCNKKILYDLLYKASGETLLELSKDSTHLGAKIGFMSILHTWGSSLAFHPHIHSIVLGGGLTNDLKFMSSKDNFLFPIYIVSKLFRGKFLDALKKLYRSNKLIFKGEASKYKNYYEFMELLSLLYSKEWIPHIKETFKGATNVIEYLGRYTHRIAICNSRILYISNEDITFIAKDYKSGKTKTITLHPVEFIRRFLMHILPKGFVKIRHYGLNSNRCNKKLLTICRNLVNGLYQKPRLEGLSAIEILKELFGIDVLSCPNCGSPNFKPYRAFYQME